MVQPVAATENLGGAGLAARLTALSLRFPLPVLILIGIVTALCGMGASQLRSVSYFEGTLPADDPELARYRTLQDRFGSDRLAVLALGCDAPRPCTSVYEPEVLDLIRGLTQLASDQPGVEAVESLATASVLTGDGVALHSERLADAHSEDEVGRFRAVAAQDPLVIGTLLSADERTTAVVVRFDPQLADDQRNILARELLATAQAHAEAAGFELYLSGDVSFTATTDGHVRRDLAVLMPIMVALLSLFLAWVFRSSLSVALVLLTVGLPVLWVFGLMGWFGRPITPISAMLPVLILVVGMTDVLHFLVRVYDLRESHGSLDEVVRAVSREVGPPTTVTALTSALGFLSLLAGRIPIIQDFGVFAAVGIVLGWALTFSLVPVVVVRRRLRVQPQRPPAFRLGDRVLYELRTMATRRAGSVLLATGLVVAASAYGVSRIVPENDSLKLVGSDDLLFRSIEFIESRLRPPASLEISFEPVAGRDLLDPDTLARLESAEKILHQHAQGGPVVSVLPVLRVAHREVAGEGLTLPRTRERASQLLLLAELADPDGVARLVTRDHRAVRLSGAYPVRPGGEVEKDLASLGESLEAAFADAGSWSVTGSVVLAARLGQLTLDSQIASFSTAFLTIFLVIFLFIRSPGLGALGMVPNVFPVAVILGFMGLTAINLDVATSMIASILLGVSVDDTIYFLMHYKRARTGGATLHDAVAFTFSVAGKPALFSAAILALGFFVLGFSRFQSLAVFGLLAGFAVLLAVVAELVLMPALLETVLIRTGRRQ
jgi:predicted RND superfamily exporter protein